MQGVLMCMTVWMMVVSISLNICLESRKSIWLYWRSNMEAVIVSYLLQPALYISQKSAVLLKWISTNLLWGFISASVLRNIKWLVFQHVKLIISAKWIIIINNFLFVYLHMNELLALNSIISDFMKTQFNNWYNVGFNLAVKLVSN